MGRKHDLRQLAQNFLSTLSKNQDEWYPHGSWFSTDNPGCLAEPEYHNVGGGLMMIYKPYNCATPRPLNEHSIYVIGDSHALAYEGLFKQYAMRNSIRFLLTTTAVVRSSACNLGARTIMPTANATQRPPCRICVNG